MLWINRGSVALMQSTAAMRINIKSDIREVNRDIYQVVLAKPYVTTLSILWCLFFWSMLVHA